MEIAKFVSSSPKNISHLNIYLVCSISHYFTIVQLIYPPKHPFLDLSNDNLHELVKSIAVNDVLTNVEVISYNLVARCGEERFLELLLENNFTLKKFWFYQPNCHDEFSFDSFVNRNKYLRKQRRFKAVKPVHSSKNSQSL